jgi:hypothetical protein
MLLITALVVGVAMMGFVGALNKRRRLLRNESTDGSNDHMVIPFLFDRPSRWLAIKCNNLTRVERALGLHNAAPCPWTEGFGKVSESKLFVSPPVHGWVIVVGQGLPDPSDDIDGLFHFLLKMGKELGTVQYFSADRVFHHHTWVRIEEGEVIRAYSWADETLWNQGPVTAAEKALEMKCYDYGEAPLPFPFSTRECNANNCEKLMQLASRWSIDPMALNSHNLRASFGIAGELSHGNLR